MPPNGYATYYGMSKALERFKTWARRSISGEEAVPASEQGRPGQQGSKQAEGHYYHTPKVGLVAHGLLGGGMKRTCTATTPATAKGPSMQHTALLNNCMCCVSVLLVSRGLWGERAAPGGRGG